MTDNQAIDISMLGWNVQEGMDSYCLSRQSDAGEDFEFSVSKENWIQDIVDYYNDFDPEEHAAEWYEAKQAGARGIPGIRVLLKDADEICDWLEELAILVSQFKEES